MENEFYNTLQDFDPDSVPSKDERAQGAPIKYTENAATMADWTKHAYSYALEKGMNVHANKFKSLHDKAVDETKFDDINNELSNFYLRAYDLQSAEVHIKAVAMLSEKDILDETSALLIESSIDKFGSLVEGAISSAVGMVTSTLRLFKEKIVRLKQGLKDKLRASLSSLKQFLIESFNDIVEYFRRLFSEFVSTLFSFVDLIKDIGKSKGYKFKDVAISFDPPSIEPITLFGFPIPFPKVSLPKMQIGFEMQSQKIINGGNTTDQLQDNIIREETSYEEFKEWFRKGKAYLNSGNYDAIKYFDKALEIYPNSISVLKDKVYALILYSKHEEAIKCNDKIIEIDPYNADSWFTKGILLSHIDKYEQAIACLDKAIDINPYFTMAWELKGTAFLKLSRYEEAIKYYDKALDIDPNLFSALNNKGIALSRLNRYEEAIACYDKVLELKPNLADVWNNKGLALLNLGRYEEALKCFDKAVEKDPNFADAWYNRACSKVKKGDNQNAIADLTKAFEIDKELKKLAKDEEYFEPIRNHESFKVLIKE
jgi:tetratricopeptide (TPR) repeat protein